MLGIAVSEVRALPRFVLGLRLAAHVELPGREPRREADVLPLLADRERQLIVGTITSIARSSSSMMIFETFAGARARHTYSAGSLVHGTMSIFSPRSSCTTAWTRVPRMPTQAPTGVDVAVVRRDGDLRAAARLARAPFTSTMPS
jgi:hypothetical protein